MRSGASPGTLGISSGCGRSSSPRSMRISSLLDLLIFGSFLFCDVVSFLLLALVFFLFILGLFLTFDFSGIDPKEARKSLDSGGGEPLTLVSEGGGPRREESSLLALGGGGKVCEDRFIFRDCVWVEVVTGVEFLDWNIWVGEGTDGPEAMCGDGGGDG